MCGKNRLSTLLLLLANVVRLCLISKFNSTYLLLTSSWFVHHKVKITQSKLSSWVLTQKSQNQNTQKAKCSILSELISFPCYFFFIPSVFHLFSFSLTFCPLFPFSPPFSCRPVSFPVLSPRFLLCPPFCLLGVFHLNAPYRTSRIIDHE